MTWRSFGPTFFFQRNNRESLKRISLMATGGDLVALQPGSIASQMPPEQRSLGKWSWTLPFSAFFASSSDQIGIGLEVQSFAGDMPPAPGSPKGMITFFMRSTRFMPAPILNFIGCALQWAAMLPFAEGAFKRRPLTNCTGVDTILWGTEGAFPIQLATRATFLFARSAGICMAYLKVHGMLPPTYLIISGLEFVEQVSFTSVCQLVGCKWPWPSTAMAVKLKRIRVPSFMFVTVQYKS
mmetsp:Transcript_136899/g.273063  ORF Transcript_136899/g.273063 Transcript_136899/m.273063 type:complete len:239 (+) Transcript_136899:803-1519(+)